MSHARRERIEEHLRVLVDVIGARQAGTEANRRATDYLEAVLGGTGLDITGQPFRTRWWEPGPGELAVGGWSTAVTPDPFSRTCDVVAPVLRCDDAADLDAAIDAGLGDTVLVLAGSVAEPVMPKAFPFFQAEEARRRADRIEQARPLAVVALAERPTLWPAFGDPDFAVPSVTVPVILSERLITGAIVELSLGGAVFDGYGTNVSARTPSMGQGKRVVISAHVDTAAATPGALDNAGGVAALLAWAEEGLPPGLDIELVFFNGEDHFDACGEQAWLAATDLEGVVLNVNLDGAGATGRPSAVVGLACRPQVGDALARLAAEAGVRTADPWYESDHALFAMAGIPAIAVTSHDVWQVFSEFAHTPADTRDRVDVAALADLVEFLVRSFPVLAPAAAAGP